MYHPTTCHSNISAAASSVKGNFSAMSPNNNDWGMASLRLVLKLYFYIL
jgi:hypothetical protein